MDANSTRRFLRISNLEGLSYTLMVGASESFALYLSVKHGLSGIELGVISSVPNLLGALAQWVIPRYVSERNLSHSIVISMLVQVFGLIGLVVCAHQHFPFAGLFGSLCLYWIGGLTAAPLWLDWMSCRLQTQFFRSYLTKRNRTLNLSTMVFFLGAAYTLHKNPELDPIYLFCVGAGARFASMLLQLYASIIAPKPLMSVAQRPVQFELAGSNLDPKHLAKLFNVSLFLIGAFVLCVHLTAPFLISYYVDTMKFDVWEYSILSAAPFLGRALFLEGWGRASGGVKPFLGLEIACFFVSFNPLLVIFAGEFKYLLMIEFIAGIFWAGYELANILIVRNLAKHGARRLFGINMAVRNIMAVAGSILGGLLLDSGVTFETMCYSSTIGRLAVAFLMTFIISQWVITRFKFRAYQDYLSTVLSLRPTLAYTGRLIFPRRLKKK